MIIKFFKVRPLIKLYLFSLLINLAFITIINTFFNKEVLVTDPRFEKTAYNILNYHSTKIIWGDNKIMLNPYEIQKGEYCNWYPIGYSLFLTIPMTFGEYYTLARTILQVILYSFFSIIVFKIASIFFEFHKNTVELSIFAAIVISIYPIYLNFSVQGSDTGMISLINALCLCIFFRSTHSGNKKWFLLLGFGLSLLYFLRPLGLLPYLVLILMQFYYSLRTNKSINYIYLSVIVAFVSILSWGIRNLVSSGEFNVSHSNVGYNLWLGNNEYTNMVLWDRLGDGAAIEDDIIPRYDKRWSYLKDKNEYQKNEFFKSQAVKFILKNPTETLENAIWKFIGFWSPLRVRDGHWSDSTVKTFVTLIFSGPVILLGLLAIIVFIIRKEYRYRMEKLYLILLLLLWMLPHLFFFSTARFRIPTDFCLILLALDLLVSHDGINRFFKKLFA